MKKLLLFLIISCIFSLSIGQKINSKSAIFSRENNFEIMFAPDTLNGDLIIGYFNPYEHLVIDTPLFVNGNIYVVNNGVLEVQNTDMRVEGVMLAMNSAQILINHVDLEMAGNIILADTGLLHLDSCDIFFPSQYNYQYEAQTVHNSSLRITNCDLDFNGWGLGGAATHQASIELANDNFSNNVTWSMMNQSSLDMDNVTDAWEFLINDSCTVNIRNSTGLILWFDFDTGTNCTVSFPLGAWVEDFDFHGGLPGLSGIPYSVSIDSTSNVNWGIFPLKYSNVTIQNSQLRTCGFIFDRGSMDTISGITNNTFYQNQVFPLQDRTVNLQNTFIQTFNYYAFDSSLLHINSSVFGEILSFQGGTIEVAGSICDGTGGFFGANGGTILSLLTQIECFVLNKGESEVFLIESQLTSPFMGIVYGKHSSITVLCNTSHPRPHVVSDTAILLDMFIDTIGPFPQWQNVTIRGTSYLYTGQFNPSYMDRYDLAIRPAGSTAPPSIFHTGQNGQMIENGILGYLDTQWLSPGAYEIFIQVYINGDPNPVECSRNITISPYTGLDDHSSGIKIYPNPSAGHITVEGFRDGIFRIKDLSGRLLIDDFLTNGQINAENLRQGIYLLEIESEGKFFRERIMINR